MVKIYVPTETWAPCCPVSHWDGARRRAELLQGVIPISTKEIIKYLLWGLTNGSEMSKFTNETAFLSSLVHKNSFLILFRKKNQTEEHKSEFSWTWCLFFFFFGLCRLSVVHRLSYPKAFGILLPQPGIKPTSPAMESGQPLDHQEVPGPDVLYLLLLRKPLNIQLMVPNLNRKSPSYTNTIFSTLF